MSTIDSDYLSNWLDGLMNYAESHGYFGRTHKLSEEFNLYEIYSPVYLYPWVTLWRVAILGVTIPQSESIISNVPQGFLEYTYQSNVIRQFLCSNRPAEKGLLELLDDNRIYFINFSDESISIAQEEKDFETLINAMFPHFTKENIDNLIRSKDENNPFLGEHLDSIEFLKEAVFQSALTVRNIFSILHVFIKPETDDKSQNSISTPIENLFYAKIMPSDKGTHNYIFPNKFNIIEQIISSSTIVSAAELRNTDKALDDVFKAVISLNRAAIDFCFELLHGDDVHAKLSNVKNGLFLLASDSCLALIGDDFDSKPFDLQETTIQILSMLNRGSEVTKNTLLHGAQSQFKKIALLCISLLSDCGYKEAIPVLQELQEDNRSAIRNAAKEALRNIDPRDDPFEPNMQKERETINNALSSDESNQKIPDEIFKEASNNAFYPGPHETHIHVGPSFDENSPSIAITHHKDGTFDIAMGNKFGLFSYVAGVLTGQITPDPSHTVGMGEAATMRLDGTVERISLDDKKSSEQEK